ncbi:CPBP family intramembrane glutamic endopeptidase [Halalkalicoccus sp. NIPERK01]|uniref:CPBP family intramembrane glutamic endopeptidase n=1 Tax=Halalkalicoccus sp. NIPERK01 TaxID=3053469 RepID=UPI00256F5F53|nr:type II CAAX endopeptidase family protein [Halalkalicoccus sp. NIPERK01]MDL5361234.1 type II CAAX endopeptidase family protein [Halalkalicoccus sp. NIPERK01]
MVSRTTDAGPLAYATTLVTVLLIGFAGFAVGSILTLVAAGLLGTIGIDVFGRPVLQIVVGVVTLQGLGFGSVALFYLSTRVEGLGLLMLSMPDLRDAIWVAAGLIALFVALIGMSLVQTTFGIESADHSLQELGTQNPEILLVLVPLSLLLVGPGEELLFRGVIQQLLRLRFGVVVGIAIASVIFAVAHVGSLTGEGLAATLFTYVVLSVILGVSYEYSENLVVPAVIHGLFNAIQFLLLYWATTTGNAPVVLLV